MDEPGGLQSMGSQKVGHRLSDFHFHIKIIDLLKTFEKISSKMMTKLEHRIKIAFKDV